MEPNENENYEQVESQEQEEVENTENEEEDEDGGILTINFDKDYYEPIYKGVMSATFSTGDYGICAGDQVIGEFIDTTTVEDSEPKTLMFIIENVEKVRFGRITTKQAKRVGYSHASILKINFKNEVPTVDDDTELYYITFNVSPGFWRACDDHTFTGM